MYSHSKGKKKFDFKRMITLMGYNFLQYLWIIWQSLLLTYWTEFPWTRSDTLTDKEIAYYFQ